MSAKPLVETRGITKAVFIISKMPELMEVLPDVLKDFASKVEQEAKANAPEALVPSMGFHMGILRESITTELDEAALTARIGPSVPWGIFVSLPTRAHFIEADIQVAPGIWRFIRLHPGTSGNPYLEESLDRASPMLPLLLAFYVPKKVLQIDQQAKVLEFEE